MRLPPGWHGTTPPKPIKFTTVIDFDDVPDGTAIDSHYAPVGVNFASVTNSPPAQGPAYARDARGAARSGTNVVSTVPFGFPAFDYLYGGIQATFDHPVAYVSVDAMPMLGIEPVGGTPTARPFLQLFDTANTVIDTAYYPLAFGDPQWGAWRTIAFTSRTANIAVAVFSVQNATGTPVFGLFDNFQFSSARPHIDLRFG